jgi:hypothetical protein
MIMNDNQDFSGNQKRFADERIAEVAATAETGNAALKALHKQMGETLVRLPATVLFGKIDMPLPPPVPGAAPPPIPQGDAEHE